MQQESAYAHLGNAAQIVTFLLSDLPPHTQTVTVSVEELQAILRRIGEARTIIRRVAAITKGRLYV